METAPSGVIPAIPTPFTPDGRAVDEASLRRIVRHVVDGGVHGIMTTGGTDEFPHLSREERRLVTEVVVAETAGAVPVYAGTAACSTWEAIAADARSRLRARTAPPARLPGGRAARARGGARGPRCAGSGGRLMKLVTFQHERGLSIGTDRPVDRDARRSSGSSGAWATHICERRVAAEQHDRQDDLGRGDRRVSST
jgi:hypothetical protein